MAAGRSPDPGPILAGRPLPWLGLLLTAGTVFIPWAFYWGLLLP